MHYDYIKCLQHAISICPIIIVVIDYIFNQDKPYPRVRMMEHPAAFHARNNWLISRLKRVTG